MTWGCQQSVLCSCAWLGGRSHASPPQRWWGWHRHVGARPLPAGGRLEGAAWSCHQSLSGLGALGFGVPWRSGAQRGAEPDLPPGDGASLVPGRSSVTGGTRGLGRGDPGEGPRQGAGAWPGRSAGDSSPLRLSVSARPVGFPHGSGQWGHGNLPLTPQDAASFRAEPSPNSEPEQGYSVETTGYQRPARLEAVHGTLRRRATMKQVPGASRATPLCCLSSANFPFPRAELPHLCCGPALGASRETSARAGALRGWLWRRGSCCCLPRGEARGVWRSQVEVPGTLKVEWVDGVEFVCLGLFPLEK